MNKYEKLIEYIINENEQKARELFHEIVVEKSRDIYESLMDEEQMGETFGGNGPEELANEIQGDHTGGIAEEEDEDEFSLDGEDPEDGNEVSGELPADGAMEEPSDEPATKADIDELKDMFAEIQAQLDGGHSEPDADNMDGMDNMDGPTEVGAEEPKFGEGMMEAEESDEDTEEDKKEEDKDEVKETRSNGPKSVAQLMREYVDQIGQVYEQDPAKGPNGHMAGTGAKSEKQGERNPKSPGLQTGPDFGGTSKNILNKTGSTNESPDGKQIPKPNNEYSKGEGKFSNEKFQNAPGGSKKTSPVGKNWESANGPEGQTTGGKVPVNTKSELKQNTGK
jgi:hypothetical protein